MDIDLLTLHDLSINGSENSLLEKLDGTITLRGKERMRQQLSEPLRDVNKIQEMQAVLKTMVRVHDSWPTCISNGTILVMEKFLDSAIDSFPDKPNALSVRVYKMLHGHDFSLSMYSVVHGYDLLQGIYEIVRLMQKQDCPALLQQKIQRAAAIIDHSPLKMAISDKSTKDRSKAEKLQLAHHIRFTCKNKIVELLNIFSVLDAWYGMAGAIKKYRLTFPVMEKTEHPYIESAGLYHLLLEHPVPYDIRLDKEKNFMFLTGANMAGKSTFIKSLGSAVFLAHTGMAVPATYMKLSYFDGLISNINISDNILKGESYFYNEVKRIRSTVEKISDERNYLILIDELFKGTNVQDAMKCTQTVVEGLAQSKHSIFILSTHLYEIASSLQSHSNIDFRFFETEMKNAQFSFNYQLKEGISNDRLGYLILCKEGVVNLLQNIS